MAVTFGLDISHYQDLSLDLAAARRDGCEFVFIKAGEGGSGVDDEFAANLAEAHAAGLLVAAYWFVRANATAAAHVALMQRVVPRDVPVILDVEKPVSGAAPTLAQARAVLDAVRVAGYRTPLAYIPLWFWRDVWGRPSLAGWPPLWSSRYPDNVVGTLASEWAMVPASYWDGFGGLSVAVLQFTSSARIAGHQPLDADAFRGTRAELAALLNQEDDMPTADEVATAVWNKALRNYLDGGWFSAADGVSYGQMEAGRARREIKDQLVSIGTTLSDLALKVAAQQNVPTADLVSGLLAGLLPEVKAELADVEHLDENAVADRLAANLAARLAQ
ncbi:glycoside hydrolase family 25 protein [Amycolatopsis sp. NPDC004772]